MIEQREQPNQAVGMEADHADTPPTINLAYQTIAGKVAELMHPDNADTQEPANIPYWEKDPRFINPEKDPEPVLTWGMVENTPTIEKQGIAMITATPGEGKTTTVMALILAITTGKKVGNFTPTTPDPAKCIVFDTEQSDNDIYRKIQILKRTNGGAIPDNLRFVSIADMGKEERKKTIMEMVEIYNPDIVVVDTITRLTTDFNDSKESQEFEDLLKPIYRKRSLIGVMHHTIGTEKAKGHLGSIMEEIGQQVWVAKIKKGGIFTLKAKKIRNYTKELADCFEVMLDPETGNLTDTTAKNAEQAETNKQELEALFKVIYADEKRGLEPKEIRQRFNMARRMGGEEPLGDDRIDDKRDEAVRCGVLTRKPNPRNRQWGIFFLTSNNPDFAEIKFNN